MKVSASFQKSTLASPLVSLIIPVRNLEKLLERCIQSILNQSYCNYEIIAVENGSIDSSWEILLAMSKTDDRIRPFQLTDSVGVSAARNFGLEKINGEYVCFVDGDDYIYPDFVKLLIEPLISGQADFTICDITYDGKKKGSRSFPKRRIDFSIESDFKLGLRLGSGSSYAKLFKRELIGSTRFPNLIIGEDSLFMLEIYSKRPILQYVPYIGYCYYQNPNSAIHDPTQAKIDSNFAALQQGKSILQKNGVWQIAKKYWKSRAKTNSIERFQQIKSNNLKIYWKNQFISFLKSDFFEDGIIKQLVIFAFKISPIFLLEIVFSMRSKLFNVARFFVNLKNGIKRRLSDKFN